MRVPNVPIGGKRELCSEPARLPLAGVLIAGVAVAVLIWARAIWKVFDLFALL